ncbi:MAG: hypothetical protein WCR97_03905 [Bacilli bacterium]
MSRYVDKTKCHVRKYYKSGHPAAIVGEDDRAFMYKGLSHENYRNRKMKLNVNPNCKDKHDSYIDKKTSIKNKKLFGKRKKNFIFDKSDYDKL